MLTLKRRYWQWMQRRELIRWSRSLHATGVEPMASEPGASRCTAAFVAEEFFHRDLRGFGGFGKVVSSIASRANRQIAGPCRFGMILPQAVPSVDRVELRRYHDTPVVLRPSSGSLREHLGAYRQAITSLAPQALITIDWYPSYLVPLLATPTTPVLVWIRDPRDSQAWTRLAEVPGEVESRGLSSRRDLIGLAREKQQSLDLLMRESRRGGRKVIFCSKSAALVQRARDTYGLPTLQPHLLPTPLDAPAGPGLYEQIAERPTLLFLGRLDPVKRPWVAFEIAARHPELQVLVAGAFPNASTTAPWQARYARLPNLQLLGHVDGGEKDRLLRSCWALVNTSAHEAEPVSFLEAFSYGKPVIACHAHEDNVRRFGYYAGPSSGAGLDEASLIRFDTAITQMLGDAAQRRRKGEAARDFVLQNHSHEAFYSALMQIYRSEGIAETASGFTA